MFGLMRRYEEHDTYISWALMKKARYLFETGFSSSIDFDSFLLQKAEILGEWQVWSTQL